MYILGVFSTRYLEVLRMTQQPAFIALNNIKNFTFLMEFLGAFPELRIAATSLDMSVRPSVSLSVCKERLGSHWAQIHEISHLSIFRKACQENFSFIKNLSIIMGTLREDLCVFVTSH